MTPPTLLTEWARLLLGSLREAGVRDVVLSPGSRSTPFTLAALRDPGLRCRTVIDERSAAFFAVGHARITGRPVLLVCTSGSAATNYFPAVVEAAESGTPLLVLTADRPLELQHAAAPQTIDQVRLYGDYARAYLELGTPEADPRMLSALPRLAAQAVHTSLSPIPGPVHLNARARKPLEPRHGSGPAELELRSVVDRLLASVPRAPVPDGRAAASGIDAAARACARSRRGLIVCGPASPGEAPSPEAIGALARATGFPVVAEPASQLRFTAPPDTVMLDALSTLLEVPGFAESHAPDVVVQVGRPPTASGWHRAFEVWADTERHVLTSRGWPDPWSTAASVVVGELDGTVRAMAEAMAGVRIDACGSGPVAVRDDASVDASAESPVDAGAAAERSAWTEELRRVDSRARALIDGSISEGFTEGAAIRTVVDRLPAGAVLALGNSLPIREVETFVPAAPRDVTVWSQRGANGIDGLISGAAGATAGAGRPTTLLIGDVSFVHDIGGLRELRDLPAPLTVVVFNNGGGRIFERLPLADALAPDDAAMSAWLTPPGVDFHASADAFGVPFARAEHAAGLDAALDRLAETGGVLEVVVPEDGTTTHQRELRRRLEAEHGG